MRRGSPRAMIPVTVKIAGRSCLSARPESILTSQATGVQRRSSDVMCAQTDLVPKEPKTQRRMAIWLAQLRRSMPDVVDKAAGGRGSASLIDV